jgi:hypothetical protein
VSYVPGNLIYDVTADHDAVMVFNESYYPGWHLRACPSGGGGCVEVPARMGGAGVVEASMPRGAWTVTLTYALPHWNAYVLAFIVGVAAAVAPCVVAWGRARSKRQAGSGPVVVSSAAATERA